MPKGGEFVKSRFLEQAALKIKVFAAATPASKRRCSKATVLDSGGFAAPQNKAACKGTNFERTSAVALFPPKSKLGNFHPPRYRAMGLGPGSSAPDCGHYLPPGALGEDSVRSCGLELELGLGIGLEFRLELGFWLGLGLGHGLGLVARAQARARARAWSRARARAAFCGSSCLALQ